MYDGAALVFPREGRRCIPGKRARIANSYGTLDTAPITSDFDRIGAADFVGSLPQKPYLGIPLPLQEFIVIVSLSAVGALALVQDSMGRGINRSKVLQHGEIASRPCCSPYDLDRPPFGSRFLLDPASLVGSAASGDCCPTPQFVPGMGATA